MIFTSNELLTCAPTFKDFLGYIRTVQTVGKRNYVEKIFIKFVVHFE